jgi:hypothetical protein
VEKDDLDLEHLDYDKNRYFIDWCENERIPERRGPRIWKFETEEERRLREEVRSEEEARRGIELEDSLVIHDYPSDLYLEWLPSLDEEKIQSRDLLDQILVCYTIKRAINGDKKAIEKLYGLYEYAAGALGAKFARQNRLPVNELKDTSKGLLRFIIEGFSPEIIIKDLLTNQKETIPHLPGWVKDFFIYHLSEYLPPRIEKVREELKSVKRTEQRDTFIFLYFSLLALLSPYSPIRGYTLWEISPKTSRKFNTYCFRPGAVKMGPYYNLSTWIFSSRSGKLYQLLMDNYESKIFIRKGGKHIRIKNMSDDFEDRFVEKSQSELTIKEKKKIICDKEKSFDKSPDEIIAELKKHGISKRDAEIFTKCKYSEKPVTRNEIAQKFNLSRRQIIRICKKIAQIFNTSS